MSMKKILIINGPNLNLLGNREKNFYGDTSLERIQSLCAEECKKNEIESEFFQSNHEGEIIEKIHSVENNFEGINFVFDERRGERISDDIISCCHQCGSPYDKHVNCKNVNCNLLFFQTKQILHEHVPFSIF